MKKKFSVIMATVALAIGSGIGTSQASSSSAYIACMNAKIGGQAKCIQAGQYCARAKQKDYKKYGFSCSKRDRNGRYHLVKS